MLDRDRALKAADLLVGIAGLATFTTPVGAAEAALGAVKSLRDLVGDPPPEAAPLAAATRKRLVAGLCDSHLPAAHPDLIVQMIDASAVEPAEIVALDRDPAAIARAMLAKLTDPAHESPLLRSDFERIVIRTLTPLLDDPGHAAILGPAMQTALLARSTALAKTAADTNARVRDLQATLANLADASRKQLEALAARFEIAQAWDLADADLRDILERKADEYRAYRAQIDRLDERVAAIANLKGAAQDAADMLDFDTVEDLLSRVDEVETDINAETKIARARNALVRSRVEDAARILRAAALAFDSIGPGVAARRLAEYQSVLRDHGDLFGGTAQDHAAAMLEEALKMPDTASDPDLRRRILVDLGAALNAIGSKRNDETVLRQAIAFGEEALGLTDRGAHPEQWGMAHNNIALGHAGIGDRNHDAASLRKAIAHLEAAAEVFTPTARPERWAALRNNLGTIHRNLGKLMDDPGEMARATAAYRDALTVRTRDAAPRDWAATQHNLGAAEIALGELHLDTAPMRRGIDAYESALGVHTPEAMPALWITTTGNLANAWKAVGRIDRDTDALQKAIATYDALLDFPLMRKDTMRWARQSASLGGVYRILAEIDGDPRTLDKALEGFRTGLDALDPEVAPLDWALVRHNMALTLRDVGLQRGDVAPLREAARVVREAIAVFKASHGAHFADDAAATLAKIEQKIDELGG